MNSLRSSRACHGRQCAAAAATPRGSLRIATRHHQHHHSSMSSPVSSAQQQLPGRRQVQLSSSPPQQQAETTSPPTDQISFKGMHHVAVICANLEKSLEFYQGLLGLDINPDRPDKKLPYRGAWLWVGPEMIHLMELPNPDPLEGRPEHGGRDRHFCSAVESIQPLIKRLEAAGVKYTMSMSGRPAVFFRDPDMNCLEVVEVDPWR